MERGRGGEERRGEGRGGEGRGGEGRGGKGGMQRTGERIVTQSANPRFAQHNLWITQIHALHPMYIRTYIPVFFLKI